MNTTNNEVKVNQGSSDELSTQILPEDTPLIFQWLPKSLGFSVPNNKKYPYMQRLVNWAEREPQRKIYLVVNGAGFKQEQIEKLREDLKPASNIQVVDYQQVSKEVGFEHFKIYHRPSLQKPLKLSEILAQMYDTQSKVANKLLQFPDILDAMRLEVMLNIEKITSHKDAIYFDFDILPNDSQQIGPISMPGSILLSSESDRDSTLELECRELENSIIGVKCKSQDVIKNMCKYAELYIHNYYETLGNPPIPTGKVYDAMQTLMNLCYHQEQNKYSIDAVLSNIQEFEKYRKALYTSESVLNVPEEWYNQFRFEKNCENIKVTSDKTWMARGINYNMKELPLHFNNAQDQAITASALPNPSTHLNNVNTESTPVSDDHAEILEETIELSSSKELYEDLCSVYEDYCSAYENFYSL